MPSYANHAFQYDHYEDRLGDDQPTRGGTRRSVRSSRRRSKKRTSGTPPMTTNARRGRRWSW